MNLNGVGSSAYTSNLVSQIKGDSQSKDAKATEGKASDVGVVYEPSAGATEKASTSKNGKVNSELIAKLKADADARHAQLKSIVEQLISKQGKAAETVSIWDQFRQGVLDGSIEVDPATAAQAEEDVSEDGYWGVQQTSERILDFAKAISGGDSSKAEAMRDAIKEGFDAAAKLWGDELPEISQKTYDAVMKGIDEWAEEGKTATEVTAE